MRLVPKRAAVVQSTRQSVSSVPEEGGNTVTQHLPLPPPQVTLPEGVSDLDYLNSIDRHSVDDLTWEKGTKAGNGEAVDTETVVEIDSDGSVNINWNNVVNVYIKELCRM